MLVHNLITEESMECTLMQAAYDMIVDFDLESNLDQHSSLEWAAMFRTCNESAD